MDSGSAPTPSSRKPEMYSEIPLFYRPFRPPGPKRCPHLPRIGEGAIPERPLPELTQVSMFYPILSSLASFLVMTKRFIAVLALCVGGFCPQLQAQLTPDPWLDTPGRFRQRLLFTQAEASLNRGDTETYLGLRPQLQDYPLLPYLLATDLGRRLSSTPTEEIRDFLISYDDSPAAEKIRRPWLDLLAQQQRWDEILLLYRPGGGIAQRCQWLLALWQSGQKDRAWEQVEPLWAAGKSQPEECTPVFQALRDSGRLTSRQIWSRFTRALTDGDTAVAVQMKGWLPIEDQPWAERWLSIHAQPTTTLRLLGSLEPHPQREPMLAHGIIRLAKQDPGSALALWQQVRNSYTLPEEAELAARRAMAMALARKGHPQAIAQLDSLAPCPADERFHSARIRLALESRRWDLVLAWIDALPEEAIAKEESWRYWRARALEQLGYSREATEQYRALARERSYYGFLAADRVGQEYNLLNRPVQISDADLRRFASRPAIQRAYEFLALGRIPQARIEWAQATAVMPPDELLAAAKLAQRWSWHDRAIFTLAKSGYWDDLDIRFPLEYRDGILITSQSLQLDASWVYAILRQESAFMEDARSSAGALGLMQLMPQTAQQVARRHQLPAPRDSGLLDPEVNIRLGSRFLAQLLNSFDDQRVLATAAYNAGPRRIRQWLPNEDMPTDLWVEGIPFTETRDYVRRVLTYNIIYRDRLSERPLRLRDLMDKIRGKAVTTTAESGSEPSGEG